MSFDLNSLTELKVLYEDNHLISVFKPANLLIQGDQTGDISLLELTRSWIKSTYQKPGNVFLGLVHRLDRPVSGVVLFAKTSKAASRLSEQFRSRRIEKTYLALVEKRPLSAQGDLHHYIAWEDDRAVAYDSESSDRRFASLSYRTISTDKSNSQLEISLHTGRKHQIRAQLAKLGCPIVGDRRYGSTLQFSPPGIALMAKRLVFFHPVRSEDAVVIESPESFDFAMVKL